MFQISIFWKWAIWSECLMLNITTQNTVKIVIVVINIILSLNNLSESIMYPEDR